MPSVAKTFRSGRCCELWQALHHVAHASDHKPVLAPTLKLEQLTFRDATTIALDETIAIEIDA